MKRRSERTLLHRMSVGLGTAASLGYLAAVVVSLLSGDRGIGDRNALAVMGLVTIGFIGAWTLGMLSVRRRP